MNKLRNSTFHYIEQEIYQLPETKRALEELTKNIIHSTPPYKEVRNTDPPDITFVAASLLVTNRLRSRMIDTILAIEISFDHLTPEVRSILEDKYWRRQHLTWSDMSIQHNTDRSTLYRWRKALVSEIANRLGYY